MFVVLIYSYNIEHSISFQNRLIIDLLNLFYKYDFFLFIKKTFLCNKNVQKVVQMSVCIFFQYASLHNIHDMLQVLFSYITFQCNRGYMFMYIFYYGLKMIFYILQKRPCLTTCTSFFGQISLLSKYLFSGSIKSNAKPFCLQEHGLSTI